MRSLCSFAFLTCTPAAQRSSYTSINYSVGHVGHGGTFVSISAPTLSHTIQTVERKKTSHVWEKNREEDRMKSSSLYCRNDIVYLKSPPFHFANSFRVIGQQTQSFLCPDWDVTPLPRGQRGTALWRGGIGISFGSLRVCVCVRRGNYKMSAWRGGGSVCKCVQAQSRSAREVCSLERVTGEITRWKVQLFKWLKGFRDSQYGHKADSKLQVEILPLKKQIVGWVTVGLQTREWLIQKH